MNSRLEGNLRRLYKLQRSIDELTREKNSLREDIIEDITNLRLEGKKFSVGDRKLCYNRKTVTQPITNKYLYSTLQEFFDVNKSANPDLADRIYNYLIDHRKRSKEYVLEFNKVPTKQSR
jgi:tRNA/tmRNA/rRNA uracil-C5-methylase (TrmA/RlmC/RlmD family)